MFKRIVLTSLLWASFVAPATAAQLYNEGVSVCAGTPVVAATVFQLAFPPKATSCGKACTKWTGACKGVAAKRGSCVKATMAKLATLGKIDCQFSIFPLPPMCEDGLKAELDTAKDMVKADIGFAQDYCETDGFANCLAVCVDQ